MSADYYKYFFGDERGETFVKVFLDENFMPKSILDLTQEAIMTGRYRSSDDNKFEGFERNDRDIADIENGTKVDIIVGPNDVHPEFVFFIQQLAARLNKLDKPVAEGTQLEPIITSMLVNYNNVKASVINRIKEKFEKGDNLVTDDFQQLINSIPYNDIKELSKSDVRDSISDQIRNDVNYKLNKILSEVNKQCKATRPVAATKEEDECEAEGLFNIISHKILYLVKNAIKVQYYDAHSTLLRNDPAQEIIENVFAKWNSVPEEQKNFYKSFLVVEKRNQVDPKKWDLVVDLDNLKISEKDYNNYRINLLKSNNDNNVPKIYDLLVILGKNGSEKDSDGKQKLENIVFYNPATNNYGKIIFTANSLTNLYKTSKYINNEQKIDRLSSPKFRISVRNLVKDILQTVKDFGKFKEIEYDGPIFDLENEGVWYKLADGNYAKQENGKLLKFGSDDDRTLVHLTRDKCYSTAVNATPEQCRKYLYECLLSGDEDGVQICLDMRKLSGNFYDVAKVEIENMHPVMAIMILQKFGFRAYEAYDNKAGQKLTKIESGDNWRDNYLQKVFLQNFDKYKETGKLTNWKLSGGGLTADQQKQWNKFLDENDYLIKYLTMVSDFVNSNPGILNKDFFGISDEYSRRKEANQFRNEHNIAKDYSFFKTLQFNHSYKHHTELPFGVHNIALSENCPPFMFDKYGNPDPVCRSATNLYVSIDPFAGKPIDYFKKKIKDDDNADIIREYLLQYIDYLYAKKHNIGPLNDLKQRIIKLSNDEKDNRNNLLRELHVLTHYAKLCSQFKGYDDKVINETNVNRLKAICRKSYTNLTENERNLLNEGSKLEDELNKSK